jgi:hypothetical protein
MARGLRRQLLVTAAASLVRDGLTFLVPVRGYAKGSDAENVAFVGIAA